MKYYLLALVLLLSVSPLWATWSLKNNQSANSGSTAVTNESAPAFSSALTNPSLIIVVCQNTTPWTTAAATNIFSVPTDTAGNTYVDPQVGSTGFTGGSNSQEIFYALNTHTTSSNVVTCHSAAGSVNFFKIVAFEYTGGATAGPVDQKYYMSDATGGSSGNNTLVMTSQTTTVNGDLIVAAFGCQNGPCSHGTSPNTFTEISSTGGEVETFVQTTAGSIGPTAGDSTSSDTWGGQWVAFTPSGTSSKPTNSYRQDVCGVSDNTSLSNNWTMVHCQATTSDSLNALTAQTILTTNPTVGNYLVFPVHFSPVSTVTLLITESLGNVAAGMVTTTAPHTITFSSGIPFSMMGCGTHSGGTCDWASKTITTGSGSCSGGCTINTVSSFTSLTVTNTVTTNSTPVSYTGPDPSCTDLAQGTSVDQAICMVKVTSTGTDTITVTASNASANFDLGLSSIEISNTNGVLGVDTAACPNANCLQGSATSNSSTGVISQAVTLSTTGELVLFVATPVDGPVGITSGWSTEIMGTTTGTFTNTYCVGAAGTNQFCLNGTNDSMKSSASSGSFTASETDKTKSDPSDVSVMVFEPGLPGHCGSCDLSQNEKVPNTIVTDTYPIIRSMP